MEFQVRLTCVQDVLDFVTLATARRFPISIGDRRHWVNGKSFMEMFCLDFSAPITARLDCTSEEFTRFCQDAARFAVSGK